jgi:hypothetical protein
MMGNGPEECKENRHAASGIEAGMRKGGSELPPCPDTVKV